MSTRILSRSWCLAVFVAVPILTEGSARAQFVWAGGVANPSPLPTGNFLGFHNLCVPVPNHLGLYNTGVPGVEIAIWKHWVVVASPESMWGSVGDLDGTGPFNDTNSVILIVDIEKSEFFNTGLFGSRPSISATPDGGVTVAFEVNEFKLTRPALGAPPVTGYPNLNTLPVQMTPGMAQDANGDGDVDDRVIVLYTWIQGTVPNAPPRGYTVILAPPADPTGTAFTRPSLTNGFLVCEHGPMTLASSIVGANPPANVVPSIYVWNLSGWATPTPAGTLRPFHGVPGSPVPWVTVLPGIMGVPPAAVAGGFHPHITSSGAPGSAPHQIVVYERHETKNFPVPADINVDGDSLDSGYYWRQVLGLTAPTVVTNVGHPNDPNPPALIHPPAPVTILSAQQPPDPPAPPAHQVANLTTTNGTVDGLPFYYFPPTQQLYVGTFLGGTANRLTGGSGGGNGVFAFSRFADGFQPGAGSERETRLCLDENVGFVNLLTSPAPSSFFGGVGYEGLYPSIAGEWMAMTTREYAQNVATDLDGDGRMDRSIVRLSEIIPVPPHTATRPKTIGCGYGAAVEDDPAFGTGPLAGVAAQVVVFLTPEDNLYVNPGLCSTVQHPYIISPGACTSVVPGPCRVGNLNANSCAGWSAGYADTDSCDVVVRWFVQ